MEEISPDGTVASLFTPEENSAALIYLRRLIGCTFDYIWTPGGGGGTGGGACNDTYDILAQLIAVINWGMLAVIAAVATYLIFASLKDTANDGELGGRSMNPSWTLVMAGLAAILVFPAFNGFSALQMATMQVAVWSTGFGDNAWRVASSKMASADTVYAAFKTPPDEGFIWTEPGTETALRQQIAEALRARVEGEVCARLIVKGAQNMATTGDTSMNSVLSPERFTAAEGSTTAERTLYYRAGSALNSSAGLCGSVSVRYIAKEVQSTAQPNSSGITFTNASEQAAIAAKAAELKVAAARATATALLTNIQTAAADLATKLFPASASGPREWGPEQVDQINQAVNDVITKTKDAGATALKSAPAALREATARAMKGQNDNGWFFAIVYQRILVNGVTVLNDLGNGGLNVMMTPAERDFSTVWGCRNLFNWGGRTCGDEMNTYFREYSTDLAALDQLRGAFASAGSGTLGVGTNASSTGGADMVDPGFLARQMNDFMYWLSHVENTNDWRDPIPQMQQSGQSIMKFGTGVLAIAGAAHVSSDIFKVPGLSKILAGLGGMIEPLGWGLLAIGAGLAFIVPMMPIFYFFVAAISWLILVAQTIITAPFWLMQMFYANRSGGIAGTSLARALTVLLALLIRPVLIIVGLIFCMHLMRIGLDYMNGLSHNFIATLGLASTGLGTSVLNVVGIVFSFMAYMSLCFILVSICCGLIDGVGDWVMEQVERGASSVFAGTGRQHAEGVLGNPVTALTAASLLSGVQRARQQAISAARSKGGKKPPTTPPALSGTGGR